MLKASLCGACTEEPVLLFTREARSLPGIAGTLVVIPQIKTDFESSGFAHTVYQPDITKEKNYGRSFIHKGWLDRQTSAYSDLEEVVYINRGYARRQDVAAYQKI